MKLDEDTRQQLDCFLTIFLISDCFLTIEINFLTNEQSQKKEKKKKKKKKDKLQKVIMTFSQDMATAHQNHM
jgi:hypothetical protein